jgi:hypothetical protein
MEVNRRDFAKTAAAATLLPLGASEATAQTVAKKASKKLFAIGVVEDETVTVPKSMAYLFRVGDHNFSVAPTLGAINVTVISFNLAGFKTPPELRLISIRHQESGVIDLYSYDGKHFIRSGVWALDSLGITGNKDPNFKFNELKVMNDDEMVEDRMNKIMEESNIGSFYLQKSIAKWNDIQHKTEYMKTHRKISQSLKISDFSEIRFPVE